MRLLSLARLLVCKSGIWLLVPVRTHACWVLMGVLVRLCLFKPCMRAVAFTRPAKRAHAACEAELLLLLLLDKRTHGSQQARHSLLS